MKSWNPRQMTAVCSFVACVVLAGCGKMVVRTKTDFVVVKRSSDATADDASKPKSDDITELSLADLMSAYGIRSFEQINETMAVLTGVSPTTAAVAAVYTSVKSQLPSNNDIKSFLASQQVGVSKLSVEYCDAMINNAAQRARVVPGFNFAAVPATALSSQGSAALIDGLIDNLWGTGLADLPDDVEARASLEGLVDDLLANENMNDVAVTLKVSKGVCSAVLSAAPVTIF